MLFLKKYWWIPILLVFFIFLTGREKTTRVESAVSEYNLEPYRSEQSIDKKQLLLAEEIERLKKIMLESNKKKEINPEEYKNISTDYPSDHIKLPDGNVISPQKGLFQVKSATTKDGRKFYYDRDGDLIEEDTQGRTINHGKQKLVIDGDSVYVGENRVGGVRGYQTDYAVDKDGNAYIDNGIVSRTNQNGLKTILGKSGGLSVSGDNLEVKTDTLNIPAGYHQDEVENGSRFHVNENGEVIETKQNREKVNHGRGSGILTKNGSRIYKNSKGEVVEIKKDGTIINHGRGEIRVDKEGRVVIKTEDGKEKVAGEYKSNFAVVSTNEGDILLTDKGIGIVLNNGEYKEVDADAIEITNEDVAYPHKLQPGELVKTEDGYVYSVNSKGELIETDPEGNTRNLGETNATFDGKRLVFSYRGKGVERPVASITKNRVDVITQATARRFNVARRLGAGEIVYTITGNTYFVIQDGLIVKIDRDKNVKKFLGALYVEDGWLFVFSKGGISTERIAKQALKKDSILKTKNGRRFYNQNGKIYEEIDNRLVSVNSFEIDGDKVRVNGRDAGEIKETQESQKIGEDEKYTPQNQRPLITASLLPNDIVKVLVGDNDITAKVTEKANILKPKKSNSDNDFNVKFNDLKKQLSPKSAPTIELPKRVVQPVSDGEIFFDEEEEKEEGVEGEDYYTIPMLTLMVADMRFGAIAPTEDSGKAKISFDLKRNVVLKNGQVIPLRGGGVRGNVKGEYNSERGLFTTDRVIFFSPETGTYFEGDLIARVISAEDYINGLEGDVISKQDKVMLEILQGELIGGFADFVATANNPFNAIQGQQAFKMEDVLAGSALQGLGKAGKEYVDFKIQNAKKLLPVVALYPGRLVILEVWETTKVKKI